MFSVRRSTGSPLTGERGLGAVWALALAGAKGGGEENTLGARKRRTLPGRGKQEKGTALLGAFVPTWGYWPF